MISQAKNQSYPLLNQAKGIPSLFDDAGHAMTQRFWTPLLTAHQKQQFTINCVHIVAKGEVYKQGQNAQLVEKMFSLHGDRLVAYERDGITPKKYKDLENTILEKLIIKNGNQQTFGFQLTRNRISKSYFGKDEQTTDVWILLLRKSCILRKFQNTYNLLKLIGKGGYAKVYQALHKHLQQNFAVKIFLKDKLDPDIDKISLIKELKIMRRLDHPNILRLHEVYENEQFIYVVSDLMQGGLFFKSIAHPVSESFVGMVMFNLLSALEYLHAHNIMHRDIKPANLMLKSPEEPTEICLVDLGVADHYNPAGEYLFVRCGTPGYLAPEILLDQPYDTKVDVFSAGVIMFIMLAGISPFNHSDTQEVLRMNQACEINFSLITISPDGMELLRALLQKDPQLRLTAAQALAHPWFQHPGHSTPAKDTSQAQFVFPQSLYEDKDYLFAKTPIVMLSAANTPTPSQPISILSPKSEMNVELGQP